MSTVFGYFANLQASAVSGVLFATIFLIVAVISKAITSRTSSITDDFVANILLRLIAIIGILVTGLFLMRDFGLEVANTNAVIILTILLSLVYGAASVARLATSAISEHIWDKYSNRALGFAVPLLARAFSLIFAIGIALLSIYLFFGADGFNTSLATIGALSFLVAYVLQEPLQNLFGGVSLLMDSPFEYGDLVILDDGKTYRVDKTGSRVTQLYDVKEHTHAYVPNVSLGNQTIINLTHPDTELREVIGIGVAYGTPLEKATQILTDIAISHPNILAPADMKLKSDITYHSDERMKDAEIERLRLDAALRDASERLYHQVLLSQKFARSAESHGLTTEQRKSLEEIIDGCSRSLDLVGYAVVEWLRHETFLDMLHSVRAVQDSASKSWILKTLGVPLSNKEAAIRALMSDDITTNDVIYKCGLLPSLQEFSESIGEQSQQPTIEFALVERLAAALQQELTNAAALDDMERQFALWRRRLLQTKRLLTKAKKCATRPGADDYLVHTHLGEAAGAIHNKFKLAVPGRQFPSVDILEFGASTVDIRLEYFVDNIAGEHFKRRERVRSELIQSIELRFDEAGIDMPYPHLKVLRDGNE